MLLEYKKDENGQDILSSTDGVHQVMMEWEKPYMEKCIEVLNPTGNVLEIGFGLGYSASKILEYDIKSYTVIECSPIVWEKFEEWKSTQKTNIPINLVKGRWEDMLCVCGIFDSIFFDDYSDQPMMFYNRFDLFTKTIHKNHMKIGSKLSMYSTTNPKTSKYECLKINRVDEYKIIIPKNCKYAANDIMYIPLFEKINESTELVKPSIDNYIQKKINTSTNIIVVDNFLPDINEYKTILLNESTNDCEKLNDLIKNKIEIILNKKITTWSNPDLKKHSYRDPNFEIIMDDCNDGEWGGILFLTSILKPKYGISFYGHNSKIRYKSQSLVLPNINVNIDKFDRNNWVKVDKIVGLYNRLVLFNNDMYYSIDNTFGSSEQNCSIVQMFNFQTNGGP